VIASASALEGDGVGYLEQALIDFGHDAYGAGDGLVVVDAGPGRGAAYSGCRLDE
jgi:hypothetical protein